MMHFRMDAGGAAEIISHAAHFEIFALREVDIVLAKRRESRMDVTRIKLDIAGLDRGPHIDEHLLDGFFITRLGRGQEGGDGEQDETKGDFSHEFLRRIS